MSWVALPLQRGDRFALYDEVFQVIGPCWPDRPDIDAFRAFIEDLPVEWLVARSQRTRLKAVFSCEFLADVAEAVADDPVE